MAPFVHPRPVVPAHLRKQTEALKVIDAMLTAALTGTGQLTTDDVMAYFGPLREQLNHRLTPEEQDEQIRYEREVREYNTAVHAYNEQIRAARQRRINAREVAALRSKACPTCLATHPGEC